MKATEALTGTLRTSTVLGGFAEPLLNSGWKMRSPCKDLVGERNKNVGLAIDGKNSNGNEDEKNQNPSDASKVLKKLGFNWGTLSNAILGLYVQRIPMKRGTTSRAARDEIQKRCRTWELFISYLRTTLMATCGYCPCKSLAR